jgi:hypothetical protein
MWRLDAMTAEDVIERCGLSREFIRLFVAPHGGGHRSGSMPFRVLLHVGSGNNIQRHSFPWREHRFHAAYYKTLIPEAISGPRRSRPFAEIGLILQLWIVLKIRFASASGRLQRASSTRESRTNPISFVSATLATAKCIASRRGE